MDSKILSRLIDIVFGKDVDVATICGYTDAQLLRATLCAEAKGESDAGKRAVLNVIINRSTTYHGESNTHPMYRGSNRVSIAILRKWQFSCWNSTSTCALFKEAYKKAVEGCDIAMTTADYTVFEGATDAQAKKILHYINPKTATSREWWVQQVKTQSNAHPTDTSWIANLPSSKLGTTSIIWRFWRIGNHVFVSGPAL